MTGFTWHVQPIFSMRSEHLKQISILTRLFVWYETMRLLVGLCGIARFTMVVIHARYNIAPRLCCTSHYHQCLFEMGA